MVRPKKELKLAAGLSAWGIDGTLLRLLQVYGLQWQRGIVPLGREGAPPLSHVQRLTWTA